MASDRPAEATAVDDESWREVVDHKIPWHFWVLVVAATIYLGYRLIQGIVWVSGRF